MSKHTQDSQVLAYLKAEIQEAQAVEQQRGQDRVRAHRLLMARHLGKPKKGEPQVVSSDASDAVESILPDLLEIFASGDDPVVIKPRNTSSRRAARMMASLIRYQLQRQMPWFKILYTWIKDGLSYRNGYVRWYWDFRYRWEENQYERLTDQDLERILWDGGELLDEGRPWLDPLGRRLGLLDCKVRERKIIKDQPMVQPIMPGCLLVSPSAQSIEDAAFVAVRDWPAMYQLQEEAQALGYDLTGVEPGEGDSDGDDERALRAAERGREDPLQNAAADPQRGRVERYVCYFRWKDDSGAMAPMTATIASGKLIHFGPNPYKRPPIEAWSPILDTHNFEGVSIVDLVEDFQRIKTALYRAMLASVRNQLHPQTVVERGSGANLNDILAGSPVIQVNPGKTAAIRELERKHLGADVFKFIELVEAFKEQRVGLTRLNQGLDAASLNHTASGLANLLNQAQKRIRLIARLFAELGLKPLFRALIWMNQTFLDRELALALSDEGEDTVINPQDLGGDFDLVVKVGLGNGDKALTVQQGQQLLQILGGLARMPGGQTMITPQNIYQLIKTIIEAMGWQPGPLITDPEKAEAQGGGQEIPGEAAPGAVQAEVGEGPEGTRVPGIPPLPGVHPALAGAAGQAGAGQPG